MLLSVTLSLTEGATYGPDPEATSYSESDTDPITTAAYSTASNTAAGTIDTVHAVTAVADRTYSPPVEARSDKCDEARVGWNGFREVFMMSALTGDGIDGLRVSVVIGQ